jgi:hypothetical protein
MHHSTAQHSTARHTTSANKQNQQRQPHSFLGVSIVLVCVTRCWSVHMSAAVAVLCCLEPGAPFRVRVICHIQLCPGHKGCCTWPLCTDMQWPASCCACCIMSEPRRLAHLLPSVTTPAGGGVIHLQSLCGLLNVPPLLHMKRWVWGAGQRWLHSFMLLLQRSLLSVDKTRPPSTPCSATSTRSSAQATKYLLIAI